MATIESVSRSKQWPLWVGSPADFQRILRRLENHCQSLIPPHVAAKTEHARSMLAWSEGRLADLREEPLLDYPEAEARRAEQESSLSQEILAKKLSLEEEELKASQAGLIRLTLTGDGNERRTVIGTAQEIIDDLDGRPIQSAEFEVPSGYIPNHSITVRADKSDGLYVRLSSADSHWCVAGFTELEDEIDRQQPRWRFVRSGKFLYPLYTITLFTAFTFLGAAWDWFPTEGGRLTPNALWNAATIYIFATPGIAVTAMSLTQKLIPAFEIVPAGKRHRGQALIAILGSCIGTITIGVLTNVISQPLTG